jgi:hypothetical protein
MTRQAPKYILYSLIIILLIFLFFKLGVFKTYQHLFSDKHLHRGNFFFRLGFIVFFSIINYGFLVPIFYKTKRYKWYGAIILAALIGMLVLPEFIIKQPKIEPSILNNEKHFKPYSESPIPLPLFEMVNMIILFFVSIYTSIVIQTRRKQEQTEAVIAPIVAIKETPQKNITHETALTVTVDYSLVRIAFEDILFIKSMDNYLQFHLKNKKPLLVRMTLKEALDKLPTEGFLRVHKSYIAANAAIDSIRNKTILIGEQEIPIGRAYEENVFNIIGK